MSSSEAQQLDSVLRKLQVLRTELVDLAFELECRGRIDAADIAITASQRVSELFGEVTISPVELSNPSRLLP